MINNVIYDHKFLLILFQIKKLIFTCMLYIYNQKMLFFTILQECKTK